MGGVANEAGEMGTEVVGVGRWEGVVDGVERDT